MNKQEYLTFFLIFLLVSPLNFVSVQAQTTEEASFFDSVFSFFKSFLKTDTAELAESTTVTEPDVTVIDWSERFLETLPKDDKALVIQKRSMYANYYYDTLTNSNLATLHMQPVNYEKDGEFYPINTEIGNEDCLFAYCVKEGIYEAEFALEPNVQISFGSTTLQYTLYALRDADTIIGVRSTQGYAQENSFIYPSVFGEGFDLQYDYTPVELKETLVIKDKESLLAKGLASDVTLTFQADTNGLFYADEGTLSVRDEKGNTLFSVKEALVVDSAENEQKVGYTIYKKQEKTYITLTVPWSFLETATYPVYIDPTTTTEIEIDIHYGQVENFNDAERWDYDEQDLDGIGVSTGTDDKNTRAWVTFDAQDIGDTTIDISYIGLYYYVDDLEDDDCSGDPTLEFYKVDEESYDKTPDTDSEMEELWDGMINDTNYGDDDIFDTEYWGNEDLGSGISEFESLLDGNPTDHFMIGMAIASNEDSDGDECNVDLDDNNDTPYLIIIYDPGCSRDSDCVSGEYCETSSWMCEKIPTCSASTYGSCPTEGAYTHSGNNVYYCDDYTSGSYDLNCYELTASLGDSDYCRYVVAAKDTCDREDYDCSSNSECSSGLICTDENVCCNSDEIFDTTTNRCEDEITCSDYPNTNGACTAKGKYVRSGDSVYGCTVYTSGSQEIMCYTEAASLGDSDFCGAVVLAGEYCGYEETTCSSDAECSSGYVCVDGTACCTDGDLWNGANCEERLACGDVEGTNGACTTAGEYVVADDYSVHECQTYTQDIQELTCYFNVATVTDEDYCTYVALAGETCILDEVYGTYSLGEYEYGPNGNMIADGTYTYKYNDFNQLSAVYDGENTVEKYVYDHTGTRIAKRVYDGKDYVTTYYIGDQVVVDDGDQTVTTYVKLGNTVLAEHTADETLYYHPDHLGSTTLITDEDGVVVNEIEYSPFGSVLSGDTARYMYTGQELDETGLQYYGARYYDSSMFHFIQPDPIIADVYNPQNLNRFSYVRNNPYRYVDPDGQIVWDLVDVGFAISDVNNLVENPSWANAGWAALSVVSLAPLLPNVAGYVRYGDDALEATGKFFRWTERSRIAENAVSSESRLNHAYKHAEKLGLDFTGKSWKTERKLWEEFNQNVIKNADNVFEVSSKQIRGEYDLVGYHKVIDGNNIVTYVFKEGPNKGLISHTVKVNEKTLSKYGVK